MALTIDYILVFGLQLGQSVNVVVGGDISMTEIADVLRASMKRMESNSDDTSSVLVADPFAFYQTVQYIDFAQR